MPTSDAFVVGEDFVSEHFFSSDASNESFRKFVLDEGVQARYQVKEISEQTLDPDFVRNPKIHRAWMIQAKV